MKKIKKKLLRSPLYIALIQKFIDIFIDNDIILGTDRLSFSYFYLENIVIYLLNGTL